MNPRAIITVLIIAAFGLVQGLGGGLRHALSIPAYAILAFAGLFAWFPPETLRLPQRWCLASAAVFFGYILARAHYSPVEYLARRDTFMVLAGLLVYLLTSLCLSQGKYRIALVVAFLGFGVAHTVVGFMQYSRGNDFMPFAMLQRVNFGGHYGIRASGFYMSPNQLAGFLEIAIIMGLAVVLWTPWKPWAKILAGYCTLVCMVGLSLTGSRGGYLSTAGAIVAFTILSLFVVGRRFEHLLTRALLITAMATCLVGIASAYLVSGDDFLRSRAASTFTAPDDRKEMWRAALQQFRSEPAFGTGAGTFLYLWQRFRPARLPVIPIYVHNDYLHLLAEYGLIGAVTFAGFLGCHVWKGLSALRVLAREGQSRGAVLSSSLALNLGALGVVVAYLIHSGLDFNLHNPANMLSIAFVFGLLASPELSLPQEPAPVLFMRGLQLTLPMLAVWLSVIALPNLPAEYYAERARQAMTQAKYSDALDFAQRGIRFETRNPLLYWYAGEAHSLLADPFDENQMPLAEKEELLNQALADYQSGLRLFPQDQNLQLGLIWALDRLKRFDESELLFQRAFEDSPNSAQLRAYHGDHLFQQGRKSDAKAEYQKSMELFWNAGGVNGLERLKKEEEQQKAEKASALP